jgi:cytochrome oxidase Cu insertion factor (SCO1/SenC/PrrC family)
MNRSLLLTAVALLALAGCQAPPEKYGAVEDFRLTERSGRDVTRDDLKGKVWLGAFIFTRCGNTCPQFSDAMAKLQKDLDRSNDFLLVSITLDPEHDKPDVLRDYAQRFGADPNRWLFLTGDKETIHRLSTNCFKLAVEENKGTARTPGNEFMHMPRAFLVDRQGEIRGYCDIREEDERAKIRKLVPYLLKEKP